LTGPEKLALDGAMTILEAEQEAKQPVSDSRIYDLVLAITGDKEKAGKALSDRIAFRLRRNEKFEG
jgi:hypothetical protein